MSVEFTLPELGENVEKGDVVRVLVAPGDVIKSDQPVLELETDKATIEVPSSVAGKIAEVRVKAGDKVKVGQVVLVVDAPGPPAGPAPSATSEPAKPAAKTAEVVSILSARPAPAASAAPGAPSRIDAPAKGEAPAPARPEADRETALHLAPPVPAAPSVRRFARELGVDIAEVPGTGPGGRIGQDDVKEHVKATLRSGAFVPAAGRAAPLPDFSKWGQVELKPMTNIRRKTAEHLSLAWQAPHVTQHDRADVTALEEFRKTYGARVEKAGGKLTVTAILIKVVTAAIDHYPQFASSVDMANERIIYKKYRHIGVAVDTPNGLLVPVIRDADRKTITEIAVELTALSQKARDKKLSLDEMAGSVFSITNLGGIGGTAFTPIVNQPEVAILGVSRASLEAVWHNGPSPGSVPPGQGPALGTGGTGHFVPRELLPLSLAYDHRAIDGADAARFLRFVAEALEQPLTMVL